MAWMHYNLILTEKYPEYWVACKIEYEELKSPHSGVKIAFLCIKYSCLLSPSTENGLKHPYIGDCESGVTLESAHMRMR